MKSVFFASAVLLAGVASADMSQTDAKHSFLGQVAFNACGSCHATDLSPTLMQREVVFPTHEAQTDIAAYLTTLAAR